MAADPRTRFNYSSTVENTSVAKAVSCVRGQQFNEQEAQRKGGILDTIGKIADLEILNDLGLGEVREGLEVIVKVSDTIRKGGALPLQAQNEATSTNYIFDTLGISPAASSQAAGFNPGVVNRAYGQAKSIYDSMKNGNFTISDIPKVFAEMQEMYDLVTGIFVPGKNTADATTSRSMCEPSPYAVDLISFAPKYKFLFVAQITLAEPYQSAWGDIAKDFSFIIKNSTRPNINFEYEEVNMYNFWTKVPKRTVYEPITMRFIDDQKNNANMFYTMYQRAMSPISNFEDRLVPELYQEMSMITQEGGADIPGSQTQKGTFDNDGPATVRSAASLGPLLNNEPNILYSIKLFHLFDYGKFMNVYNFFNPKITSMNLDDLDMADNGNGNELEIQFSYDSLYVDNNVDVENNGFYDITELSTGTGAVYPIRPVF